MILGRVELIILTKFGPFPNTNEHRMLGKGKFVHVREKANIIWYKRLLKSQNVFDSYNYLAELTAAFRNRSCPGERTHIADKESCVSAFIHDVASIACKDGVILILNRVLTICQVLRGTTGTWMKKVREVEKGVSAEASILGGGGGGGGPMKIFGGGKHIVLPPPPQKKK